MQQHDRLKYLKIALYVFGVTFIVGVPAMMMWIWPSGWGWAPAQPEYEQMIMGIYMTLGVFLVRAAKDPVADASLIGDIPALFLVAFVLWYLMPKKTQPFKRKVCKVRVLSKI